MHVKPVRSLLLLAFGFAAHSFYPAHAKDTARTLNFVVAHNARNPMAIDELKKFAARIEKGTAGSVHVNLTMQAPDVRELHGSAIKMVSEGSADMTQVTTTSLGKISGEFELLDLPFLFRDRQHARAVFDGPLGERLSDGLRRSSRKSLRALGFVYCGGMRNVYGQVALRKESDLEKLVLDRPSSAWSGLFWSMAGAKVEEAEPSNQSEDFLSRLKARLMPFSLRLPAPGKGRVNQIN